MSAITIRLQDLEIRREATTDGRLEYSIPWQSLSRALGADGRVIAAVHQLAATTARSMGDSLADMLWLTLLDDDGHITTELRCTIEDAQPDMLDDRCNVVSREVHRRLQEARSLVARSTELAQRGIVHSIQCSEEDSTAPHILSHPDKAVVALTRTLQRSGKEGIAILSVGDADPIGIEMTAASRAAVVDVVCPVLIRARVVDLRYPTERPLVSIRQIGGRRSLYIAVYDPDRDYDVLWTGMSRTPYELELQLQPIVTLSDRAARRAKYQLQWVRHADSRQESLFD